MYVLRRLFWPVANKKLDEVSHCKDAKYLAISLKDRDAQRRSKLSELMAGLCNMGSNADVVNAHSINSRCYDAG